jgi:hypothetical protein
VRSVISISESEEGQYESLEQYTIRDVRNMSEEDLEFDPILCSVLVNKYPLVNSGDNWAADKDLIAAADTAKI